MKLVSKFIFLLIGLFSIYLHYINNISGQIQWDLYADLDTGVYREQATARFDVLNTDLINLSVSSLPMKAVIARYYFLGERYTEALNLLDEASYANPYIMFGESIKSEIFYKLGVKDSAVYYAEKAFSGIPNNSNHFVQLSRIYVSSGKYDKIDSLFQIIKHKRKANPWRIYLATKLTREDSLSEFSIETAKEALKIFNSNDQFHNEIRLSSAYILYGSENIQSAILKAEEASKLFDKSKFRESAILYEEASKLNPLEYTYIENAGISNYLFGYIEKSIPLLEKVVNSLNPKTGKSEFILAGAYAKLGDFDKACLYIGQSSKFDYKESYRFIGEYCK